MKLEKGPKYFRKRNEEGWERGKSRRLLGFRDVSAMLVKLDQRHMVGLNPSGTPSFEKNIDEEKRGLGYSNPSCADSGGILSALSKRNKEIEGIRKRQGRYETKRSK